MYCTPDYAVRMFCRIGLAGLGLLFLCALAWADAPDSPSPPVEPPLADESAQSVPTAAPLQAPPSNPLATQGAPASPGTVVTSAPIENCDYWIVSSRNCRGKGGDTRCLNFFHRTSDRELREMGRDAFTASFRPDVPVCFIVHGSYNWWRDVVNESRKINRWVRSADPAASLQVVFFTWPSDGNMPFLFPVDIAVLGRKSAAHSYYLARLISELPPEQPVCVLGHSHGARATVAALHLLGGGTLEDGQTLAPGSTAPQHLRAVLIAAAIDRDWLNPGQRYGQALFPPERVLLLRNSRDATLAIYPLRKGWGGQALGRNGLTTQDRLAMNGLHAKVTDLDAAQFAGPNHSFADYHEHPELAAAALPYVYLRAEGKQPTAAPARPYDEHEPSTPIRPKPDSETAAPAQQQPVSTDPQLVPAGAPFLVPPETDDEPAAKQPTESPRLLRIVPRARNASQQKSREELPVTRNNDAGPVRSQKPKSFDLWLEE
ncbi:MAG: hypothetical protein ACT4QC_06530 [Planctomycetaceae bacterium]